MPGLDQIPPSQPKLTFAALTRLSESADFEKTVVENGYRYDQRLIKNIELFKTTPQDFQDWADRRDLSQREVQPLAALDVIPTGHLSLIAFTDISRNYGAQIIELLVENILLGHAPQSLMPAAPFTADKTPKWIEQLKALRFPETQKLDQTREKELTSLPWTKDFKTRWHRQGDQSGLEVKFTITNKKDLEAKLESLQRLLDGANG